MSVMEVSSEHAHDKPVPWDFVEVRWEDSASDHDWMKEEELTDVVDIVTRGWLVKKTKRGVKLAASYYWCIDKWIFGEAVTIPYTAFTQPLRVVEPAPK